MNDAKSLLLGVTLFAIGQTAIWIQTNGQFIWKWVERNPLLVSIFMGVPISYIFIKATKLTVNYFDTQMIDSVLYPKKLIISTTNKKLSFELILNKGVIGEIYNIGCHDEYSIMDITKKIIKLDNNLTFPSITTT